MAGTGSIGGPTDWTESSLATVLSQLQTQGVFPGQRIAQGAMDNINSTAPYLAQGANSWLGQGMYNNAQNTQSQLGNIQSEFGNLTGNGYNNTIGGGINGLAANGGNSMAVSNALGNSFGNIQPYMANTANTAGQAYTSGGWTPQYAQGYNDISQFLNQGTPGVGQAAGAANSLIGGLGGNNFNQALEGYALQSAQNGGMSQELQMLTPSVQNILGNQGNTGASNELTGQGSKLFNQQALMNPAQAVSLARNQAATNYAQQATQMEQQAQARGGGPGAVVANGMQNQTMSDFANQIAQGVSGAETNALQGQQQLQLSQQGLGANAVGQGGSLANSLLGTGLSSGTGIQNAATGLLGAYLGGGGTGSQNQLGMLGQGGNLAQMLESGGLGGINALSNMMGNQNQYALGSGNLYNNMTNNMTQNELAGIGQNTQLYNLLGQLGIGQGQLGNQMFQSLSGAQNNAIGQGISAQSANNNTYSNAMNPLQSILQSGTNIWNTGLGSQASLFGGAAGSNASGSAGFFGSNGLGGGLIRAAGNAGAAAAGG